MDRCSARRRGRQSKIGRGTHRRLWRAGATLSSRAGREERSGRRPTLAHAAPDRQSKGKAEAYCGSLMPGADVVAALSEYGIMRAATGLLIHLSFFRGRAFAAGRLVP